MLPSLFTVDVFFAISNFIVVTEHLLGHRRKLIPVDDPWNTVVELVKLYFTIQRERIKELRDEVVEPDIGVPSFLCG